MSEQIAVNPQIIQIERPVEYPQCAKCPALIAELSKIVEGLGDLNHPDNRIETRTSCLPGIRNTSKMTIGTKILVALHDDNGNVILVKGRNTISYDKVPKTRTMRTEVVCPGLVAENS